MFDSTFPSRLGLAGHRNAVEFIHSLFETYSKCHLTKSTDRGVAILGLHNRIGSGIHSPGAYGIFQGYYHNHILWHASDDKLKRIEYSQAEKPPSWSWMAYTGGVQFERVHPASLFNRDLYFECEHKPELLAAYAGKFQNCTTELDGTRYAILDFKKVKRGWIRYDVEELLDLDEVRCVFVESTIKPFVKLYMLVVRRTSVDGEYVRVGLGKIPRSYVKKEALNIRIV
jgi:hypothetical protein